MTKTLKKIQRNSPQILATLVLAGGALLMIGPFLWMITTALGTGQDAFSLPPNWLPTSFNVQNYSALIESDVPFLQFAFNSFFVATIVTLSQLLTCAMAAYAFARLQFPWRKIIFFSILASLMIPIQVTIIPVFLIMRSLQLVDTLWALILPLMTNAFGVFLLRQFFLTLPKDLFDAAKIDGASQWTLFSQIALPLARPTLAALAIITFTNTWNSYFMPLIFINSWDKMTLPLGMQALSNVYGGGNVAVIMAGVSLAIIPVLLFFLIAQKHIIEGMMRGSIKG